MNSRWVRRLAASVMALGAGAVLTACSGGTDAVDQNAGGQFRYVQANRTGTVIAADQRKAAGAMTGDLLSGSGTYSLAAQKGQVVVVNFLASWCGPCQIETPNYERIYQQRKASGTTFVGVDVKDQRGAAQSWVAEKVKASFPIVFDPTAKTALQLGKIPVVGLPGTVLIDKQGRVAAVYTGAQLPADLNPVLDRLVKES